MRRQAGVAAGALLAALYLAPSSFGDTVFALTTANGLEHFDSATPSAPTAPIAITGLQVGEALTTIDFRPATAGLYALSNQSRMYRIDASTGVATQVGPDGVFTLSGTDFGMDVNPVVDRIRVVSDADQNLRLDPANGSLTAIDAPLAYASGDPNFGTNPNEVALAYSNNVAGAMSTTLYGIDSGLDVLVTQGGPGGVPSPNTGALNTVGALGVNTTGVAGLDISPSGTAYAVLHSPAGGVGSFYTVNLAGGAATLVGTIGGSAVVVDIAVRAGPTGVSMRSLSAARTSRGAVVRWRTGAAGTLLGFRVYRRAGARRLLLTKRLLPAVFAAAGCPYAYVDRSSPAHTTLEYWIQAVSLDGTRTWFGPAVAAGGV